MAACSPRKPAAVFYLLAKLQRIPPPIRVTVSVTIGMIIVCKIVSSSVSWQDEYASQNKLPRTVRSSVMDFQHSAGVQYPELLHILHTVHPETIPAKNEIFADRYCMDSFVIQNWIYPPAIRSNSLQYV